MFDIEYKGGNTVVVTTKKSKLVTDPKLSIVGLKDINIKGAVVLGTESRLTTGNENALLSIEGPGEYEVADFSIRGVAAQRHLDTAETPKLATIYRIEVGDVRIGVIGNIDPKLSEDQLEALGIIDILIIPVGGNGYTLDATAAAHLARSIDSKVIIPVHYADKALKYEVTQDNLEVFTKEFGGTVETTPKYKVKAASSLPPTTTIVEVIRT